MLATKRVLVGAGLFVLAAIVGTHGTMRVGLAATPAPATTASPTPTTRATPLAKGAPYDAYIDAYWRAQTAYVGPYTQDQAARSKLTLAIYKAQAQSTGVILILVIVIVVSGLLMAAAQVLKGFFYSGHLSKVAAATGATSGSAPQQPAAPEGPSPPGPTDSTLSTFKASLQGIEVQSASIGFLILVVSLAFFFLYLKFVYPISPTPNP